MYVHDMQVFKLAVKRGKWKNDIKIRIVMF